MSGSDSRGRKWLVIVKLHFVFTPATGKASKLTIWRATWGLAGALNPIDRIDSQLQLLRNPIRLLTVGYGVSVPRFSFQPLQVSWQIYNEQPRS